MTKRRAEALRLSLEGHSLREIATAIGISTTQAWKDIAAELKPLEALNGTRAQELAARREHERERSLARCEMLIRGAMPGAQAGKDRPAEIILKAEARRARLLGLDAPVKTETTISLAELKGMSDARLAEIAAGATAQATEPVADADASDDGEAES